MGSINMKQVYLQIAQIAQRYSPEKVVLFGSRVRGTNGEQHRADRFSERYYEGGLSVLWVYGRRGLAMMVRPALFVDVTKYIIYVPPASALRYKHRLRCRTEVQIRQILPWDDAADNSSPDRDDLRPGQT